MARDKHDYRNCADPGCAEEVCQEYRREARERGYDEGFMRGAAAGYAKGRRDAADGRQED